MENASKALIIAGSILLSIAIITVGMFVFRSVSDLITGSSNLTPQQIDTYNREFLAYSGNQRGAQVKSLCTLINNHNMGADDSSELIAVVEGEATNPYPAPTEENAAGTTTAEITTISNSVLSGRTYTVSFGYDADSGLITQVGIQLVQ